MNETLVIKKRIQSIDLLRGLVMIIMALDHTRNFFHAGAMVFGPADLTQTNVPLFFTRWITHFCAPVFMFLTGTSAFLVGQRKPRKELSFYLLTRGLWLVFLELTVVNFGWTFNIHFPFFCSRRYMGFRHSYDSAIRSGVFTLSCNRGNRYFNFIGS